MSYHDLFRGVMKLFNQYDADKHLRLMKSFTGSYLTEHQFTQFLGKSRSYQCLPARDKKHFPYMELTDNQSNMVAKAYDNDDNFKREHEENGINL